ncbi:hypothetical protein B0J13DRAFT_634323 [Dactylonectria estremocensis]|uniref:Histidine kinase group protein n=1 Tax=Dactylonectria estremocensis TaxID=1079267 RepID=A0A9P9JE49_9HYPO|nr:hypothetical protein B0J13DRAFT_634323 [Dactylonectria estremocensis]
MAKTKNKQATGDEEQLAQVGSPSTSTRAIPQAPVPITTNSAGSNRRPRLPKPNPPASLPAASIAICRNKHWRFISSFIGPWIQMPIEILETVANINYNHPRPRPNDPALLFDLVKIRRLIDEATNLAVRAAGDIASPILTSVNGGLPVAGTGGHGGKLSRERRFRMREQASQKLGRAYRLDEIACSVATMQGASPLEEVGGLVLHRNPDDPDAKYVHFFHEKIPTRQLVTSTSLQPLMDIISERPTEVEVLRTRATVKAFKNDCEGAAQDLTLALSIYRSHLQPHSPTNKDLRLQEQQRTGRRTRDIILAEKDRPSSLEGQFLFQRATTYLALACQHVAGSVSSSNNANDNAESRKPDENIPPTPKDVNSPVLDKESQRKQAESRKLVKTYAKRALRDYLAFIAQFDYAPHQPVLISKAYNDRVSLVAHGARNARPSEFLLLKERHVYYPLSDLFAAVPPSDLPPFPPNDLTPTGTTSATMTTTTTTTPPDEMTCECVTYHPLLSDALHALLLCHCLNQTSAKELLRHAHMVARLVRLMDGYPVFQECRSSARSDWIGVIRQTENWLQLSDPWEVLCEPAPLPIFDLYAPPPPPPPGPNSDRAASAVAAILNQGPIDTAKSNDPENTKGKTGQQSTQAPSGAPKRGRGDKGSHTMAHEHSAHACAHTCAHAEAELTRASVAAWESMAQPAAAAHRCPKPKQYPGLQDRSATVARWVREAPIVTGMAKRKKRVKKPGQGETQGGAKLALDIEEPLRS